MKSIKTTLTADAPVVPLTVRGPSELQAALDTSVIRGLVVVRRAKDGDVPERNFGLAVLLDSPGLCAEDVSVFPDLLRNLLEGMFGREVLMRIMLADIAADIVAELAGDEGGETDQPLH